MLVLGFPFKKTWLKRFIVHPGKSLGHDWFVPEVQRSKLGVPQGKYPSDSLISRICSAEDSHSSEWEETA